MMPKCNLNRRHNYNCNSTPRATRYARKKRQENDGLSDSSLECERWHNNYRLVSNIIHAEQKDEEEFLSINTSSANQLSTASSSSVVDMNIIDVQDQLINELDSPPLIDNNNQFENSININDSTLTESSSSVEVSFIYEFKNLISIFHVEIL
ncbi:hypothetical protein TKK_0014550 [Trichogramma kaykai]